MSERRSIRQMMIWSLREKAEADGPLSEFDAAVLARLVAEQDAFVEKREMAELRRLLSKYGVPKDWPSGVRDE